MAIDFPLSPLRRYLWDHLSEIIHPDEHQQRRRPTPSGLSSTWAAGTGHEGFDGFRIELKKFSSGQSNPTFLLVVHLSPPSGASPPSGKATSTTTCRFVLRKKPASVKVSSAHAVEREFRILRALRLDTSSNVPVPRALLLCEDTAVIGTAFYVMEFVQGRKDIGSVQWYKFFFARVSPEVVLLLHIDVPPRFSEASRLKHANLAPSGIPRQVPTATGWVAIKLMRPSVVCVAVRVGQQSPV